MIENITPQIKTLLAQNRKAEAISLALEQVGDLSEAQSVVTQLEKELNTSDTHEVVKAKTEVVPEENNLDLEELEMKTLQMLQTRSTLQTLKWLKETSGWHLKDAMDFLDKLVARSSN